MGLGHWRNRGSNSHNGKTNSMRQKGNLCLSRPPLVNKVAALEWKQRRSTMSNYFCQLRISISIDLPKRGLKNSSRIRDDDGDNEDEGCGRRSGSAVSLLVGCSCCGGGGGGGGDQAVVLESYQLYSRSAPLCKEERHGGGRGRGRRT